MQTVSTPTWNIESAGTGTVAYPSRMEGDRDTELYLAACKGDRDAVTDLVRGHQRTLLGVARTMGMRHAEALDVVQLAWFKFFQHLKSVEGAPSKQLRNPAGVRAWLITTTKNAARDVHRKRRPAVSIHAGSDDHQAPIDVPDPADTTELIEETELREAVRHTLTRLDEPCRELLALCIADPPLSYEKIGEILGRPVGSLGPTRQRCLEKLRMYLKGVGYE